MGAFKIEIVGVGGQGVILVSKVLAALAQLCVGQFIDRGGLRCR